MKFVLKSLEKSSVFAEVETYLASLRLPIVNKDAGRPWGGFFVIDESQGLLFGEHFFAGTDFSHTPGGKLSPKILLVQPHMRLSWQYHHRRAEIWKVISGRVGVITSHTDKEENPSQQNTGDIIRLAQGQRHRLVGLDEWGVLAEIWQHTDANYPSDEDDIVRLQDDFGRGT